MIIYLIYRKHRDMVGSGLYLGLCLTLVFVARFLIEYTKDIQEAFEASLPLDIIGDDPAACVNCHIMSPWYVTWQHSSHGRDATCNDCHVPHTSLAAKYFFKGLDGMKHVGYFVTNSERQAITAEDASAEVIMDNCIRCHTELNTRMVRTGKIDYMLAKRGEGFACWDCHRNVPHGGMNTLSSTPGAETQAPIPPSPVPEWLQKALGH